MALLSILFPKFRTSFKNDKGEGILTFDVTLNEDAQFSAEVSDNPVESGPEVTDHIQLKNPKLSFEGIVSETPLDLLASITGGVTSAVSVLGQQTLPPAVASAAAVASGVTAGFIGDRIFGGSQDKATQAQELLIRAYEQKTLLKVITKRREYSNMVIETLRFPRDPQTGRALRFSIELRQIRIVQAQIAVVESLTAEISSTASSQVALGKQPTTPTSVEQSRKASVLFSLGRSSGVL